MAKKSEMLKVELRNDWYDGGKLLRPDFNPHEVSPAKLYLIPSSAKVEVDGEFIAIDDYRGQVGDQAVAADKAVADKDAADKKSLKI